MAGAGADSAGHHEDARPRTKSLLPQRQRKMEICQGYAPIAPESKRRCVNTTETKDNASH
jgi:hypothetical protein